MAKSNSTRRVFLFMAAIWTAWIALPSTSARAQVFLNASEIITPADYPTDALKRGDEGITTFKLGIGRDGDRPPLSGPVNQYISMVYPNSPGYLLSIWWR